MRILGILALFLAVTAFTVIPDAHTTPQLKQVEPKKKMEEPKVKTVSILTSAICEDCKHRIEKKLNYTKGILYAELDLETKKVEVKFKTKFLNENQVRELIASVGYDADDVKRDEAAFEKLPKCCKSPGHCSRD